ncbi:MAG: hypothetical protein NT137_05270 [Methanomassiliicoccales archaeon]|nr:hypothetical protein [Methanomassiliicoccales archaeon]
MPASAAEARKLAYWAQWICLLFGIIWLVYGIIDLILWSRFGLGLGWYGIVGAAVNIVTVFMLKKTVFDAIDQGRFREANDKMLIWAILTIIFGLLGGIFLLLAYLKMNEVFQPNYQPYPAGQYQAAPQGQPQPPQPASQPAPQAPQPAPVPPPQPQQPASQQKHAEMVKCKKCGVQYPAFMRTCPNCNEPR